MYNNSAVGDTNIPSLWKQNSYKQLAYGSMNCLCFYCPSHVAKNSHMSTAILKIAM